MSETKPMASSTNRQVIILALLGVILLIVGLYIVFVPGAPLRGSGAGTVLAVLGVLFLLGAWRRSSQKAK